MKTVKQSVLQSSLAIQIAPPASYIICFKSLTVEVKKSVHVSVCHLFPPPFFSPSHCHYLLFHFFSFLWQQIILYFPCQTFRRAHFSRMLTEWDHRETFVLWNKRIAVYCFIQMSSALKETMSKTVLSIKFPSVWHFCLRSFRWFGVCFLYVSCFLLSFCFLFCFVFVFDSTNLHQTDI